MPSCPPIRPSTRVIFFDAVGTLIYLPLGVAHHYVEVADRHGLHLERDSVRASFSAAWNEMPIPEVNRKPRPDDDRGWWRDLVNRTLDRLGASVLPSFDREAYFAELYVEFSRSSIWATYSEVPGVLDGLSKTHSLGIISNFDGRLRPILEGLGIAGCFEHVIISSEVGADKPDPWIYAEAARRFGIKPADALHVGDEPQLDWEAAADAGFQVFRLDRSQNSLLDLLKQIDLD